MKNSKSFSGHTNKFREYGTVTDDEIFHVLEDVDLIAERSQEHKLTLNCPVAFDIETYSFYQEGEKMATMYVWTMDLNGFCFHGRTWEEFTEVLERIDNLCGLTANNAQMIIYVHNLGYEFQFMRKFFRWDSVFARQARKPMKAVTGPFVFKCSWLLSGYALAKVADNLQHYKIQKLVGDLDYNIPRHSGTPLTDKELGYCYNDVIIIEYYIREEIERCGSIVNIPLTQTGYVRKMLKDTFYPKARNGIPKLKARDHVINSMKYFSNLTIEPEEYKLLKRAYIGGFVHASAWKSNQILENVGSYDLTSAYPSKMAMEQFPVSKGRKVKPTSKQEFKYYLKHYCCVFDITFYNIREHFAFEHILSASKCWKIENAVTDNGRVVSADVIGTSITEVDLKSIVKFYRFSGFDIGEMYIYTRGYLPIEYIETILQLYEIKTSLKGIEGKEEEYMHGKQLINSLYGMLVTDISPKPIEYNGEWVDCEHSIADDIREYNEQKKRVVYYPWGVYVTAYTRQSVYQAILEAKNDHAYTDTDSEKLQNPDKHKAFFDKFNRVIDMKIKAVCAHYNLDSSRFSPVDKYGKPHTLGYWDFEGYYALFKTLGAKRYLVKGSDGRYSLTISGVHKQQGVCFLQTFRSPFQAFSPDLEFPPEYSGKNTLTYIDNWCTGMVTDLFGTNREVSERSYVHAEGASYKLSMADSYLDYLSGIAEMLQLNSRKENEK